VNAAPVPLLEEDLRHIDENEGGQGSAYARRSRHNNREEAHQIAKKSKINGAKQGEASKIIKCVHVDEQGVMIIEKTRSIA